MVDFLKRHAPLAVAAGSSMQPLPAQPNQRIC